MPDFHCFLLILMTSQHRTRLYEPDFHDFLKISWIWTSEIWWKSWGLWWFFMIFPSIPYFCCSKQPFHRDLRWPQSRRSGAIWAPGGSTQRGSWGPEEAAARKNWWILQGILVDFQGIFQGILRVFQGILRVFLQENPNNNCVDGGLCSLKT